MRILLSVTLFFVIGTNTNASFLDDQLKYSRVRTAYKSKIEMIKQHLSDLNSSISKHRVMIKAYKYEQVVRVFVRSKLEEKWRVYREYPFCWSSGEPGPKRQQGDLQIPEGYYKINHFNPYSNFHLSLGVSYPNKSDRIKSTASDKGGAIYMHGGCATIGCIPIRDEPIKEVYILCVLAKNNGQPKIPIQIFPFDYSPQKFSVATEKYPEHKEFWSNLFIAEKSFQKDSIQVGISIDSKGNYMISSGN